MQIKWKIFQGFSKNKKEKKTYEEIEFHISTQN